MAGAPPGFSDLINRKYDIQQESADSESALRAAQAQQITGSLDSENALRRAQAFQTTEAGKTIGPTADASIASTYAQIPGFQARANLENSQAGYYGAEADASRANVGPAEEAERANYWYAKNTLGNFGLGGATTGGLKPTGGDPTLSTSASVTNPYQIPTPASAAPVDPALDSTDPNSPAGRSKASTGFNGFRFFAGGTDDVQPLEYDPMNAYAKGTARVPAPAGGTPPMPGAPGMGPGNGVMAGPPGAMDFHTVMAHAMHALATSHPSASNPMHAAGGAATVPTPKPPAPAGPGPGQTITNGDWGSGGQNQDLRAKMGMGKPVQAAKGKTTVPGKGPGNVDSVPSVLAPGEAVLNQGAADHMGRGAIAALNAMGAQKMAMAGAPPMSPTGQPMASAGPPMGAPAPKGAGTMAGPKGSVPGGAPKPSAKPANSKQPQGKPNPKAAPGKPPEKVAPKPGKK